MIFLRIIPRKSSKINAPNVIYVKNKMSKGANGARNTGILLATEKFIAFHDSDDIWFPEKLKYQMRTMIEKSCDLVFAIWFVVSL